MVYSTKPRTEQIESLAAQTYFRLQKSELLGRVIVRLQNEEKR